MQEAEKRSKPESPRGKEEDAGAKREKRVMMARKASMKELAHMWLGAMRWLQNAF